MKLTATINKAINVAARQHFGQNRKVINIPYIIHPFSVAILLSQYTDDDTVIAAGLLHDVLEDCEKYSYDQMVDDFGEDVARLVIAVSDKVAGTQAADWKTRKDAYLAKMKTNPEGALMITAADKLHNLQSMVQEYEEHGGEYHQNFNSSANDRLWYYGEVITILKDRLDNPIVADLETVLTQMKEIIVKQ